VASSRVFDEVRPRTICMLYVSRRGPRLAVDSPIVQADPCGWAAFLKEIISRVIIIGRYL